MLILNFMNLKYFFKDKIERVRLRTRTTIYEIG